MTGLGSVLKRRALVYAVLPILLLLVVPAASAWAVPVFGTPTPAPGATISAASAAVSVAVSDAAGLSSTPTMTVDGVPAVCRMEYYDTGGTWYDDGCESWYQPAYDYTRGTIRADLTGLANGSRTIAVRAVNRAGVGQVSSWSLNVSSAPLLSAPFPANGGWVADVRPTISAKVAANAPVASVSLTVDGAPTSAWYDATTKKVMGTPLANLADGLSHTAVARATDSFGLTGSITWTFGTATTGPVIGGQLPAADAQLTTGTTRIAFSAADPSSFSAVSLKLDGASVPVTWDYVDMGGSWYDDGCEGWYEPAYDYTRMSAGYSATGLRDGTHTVVAEATGRTGIASTATWTFRVTSRPIIDAASPANGACTANLRPVISARISDNDTITATTMALDGAAVPATYDASAKTIRFTPLTPLADDSTHTVLVTASDAAGNPSSLQWSFRTKSSPPVFSGASPAAGSVTSAYRPAISLSVSDAAGLSSTASLSVDGVKVASSFAYVDAGGTWEDDDFESWYVPAYDYTRGTISYTPAADLTNGPHTVTVEQANSLGVKSTYAWTFTITAPPVLSSPVPANGASVVTLSPTISVAVKANVGIAAATATLDGVPTPALWDAAAKVVRVVPIAPLPDNTGHTVCVTVTDAAGQQGSYLWSFNTDVSGPSIGAVSPSAGATLSANSVRISVVASDPAGMAGMQTMKIDGATVPALWAYVEIGGYWVGTGCSAEYIAEYDQTQGTLAYQATALSDGQHTVSVTLANVSGITATKTWTFTVAVPPQITTPVPSYGAVIATLTPTIGAKVTDNGTVATTRVTLDGVTIASSYDPASKTVTAMAIPALSDDTQHTAVVYATDAVGGASSLSWSFRTHTAVPTLLTAAPATSTAVWDPVVSIDARRCRPEGYGHDAHRRRRRPGGGRVRRPRRELV
jgi:hypothetical protein